MDDREPPALGVPALGAPSCGPATLAFDGVTYAQLPRVLHLTGIASRADERTLLVVSRIGGNLDGATSAIGGLQGTLYDDTPTALVYTAGTGSLRQFRSELDDTFPSTAPPFETAIPAGRTGWLRIRGAADVGLAGAALVLRAGTPAVLSASRAAGAPASTGPLTGAHLLRTATPSAANSLTFTAEAPGC